VCTVLIRASACELVWFAMEFVEARMAGAVLPFRKSIMRAKSVILLKNACKNYGNQSASSRAPELYDHSMFEGSGRPCSVILEKARISRSVPFREEVMFVMSVQKIWRRVKMRWRSLF